MLVRLRRIPVLLGLTLECALAGFVLAHDVRAEDTPAGSPTSAEADSELFSPAAIKAAYIVNLMRFTTWPDDRQGGQAKPLIIAVANNRALEDELFRISADVRLRGRRLRVVRVRSARDFETCHLVWIEPAADAARDFPATTAEALSLARGRPLLTVSDMPGFLDQGGMVELYREGSNLRFAIDARDARIEGVELSSRLLALSRDTSPSSAEIMPPAPRTAP